VFTAEKQLTDIPATSYILEYGIAADDFGIRRVAASVTGGMF
jgi:hypothetical protein